MFSTLETTLLSFIHLLPLELFVFVASFIEEVFAPIPSAAVLLLTGSFAKVQGLSLLGLIPLVFIAALGKTIGAIIVYYFSDKISELMLTRFGKFFIGKPESIKAFSKKITNSPRDYVLLTVLRALPVLPSAAISIGSGVLKIPWPIFITSTFLGSLIRDGIFIYIGYSSSKFIDAIATHSTNLESLIQTIILLIILGTLIYFFVKKYSR